MHHSLTTLVCTILELEAELTRNGVGVVKELEKAAVVEGEDLL